MTLLKGSKRYQRPIVLGTTHTSNKKMILAP